MQALNRGVAACARRLGPWCVEAHYYGPGDSFADYLLAKGYDGVIATLNSPSVGAIAANGVPLVMAMTPQGDFPSVLVDDEAVGVLAAEHLIECGYRRFAFFGVGASWSRDRYKGFAGALASRGFPVVSNQMEGRWPTDAVAADREVTRNFLSRLGKPVGLLACNDGHGRHVADFAAEMGLRVPGELAVLGVDNDELSCETGVIPMSSVDPDLYRLGFEAALHLDRRMRGEGDNGSYWIKPKGIVRRESTSQFIHDDPDVAAALRFLYQHACEGITVDDICGHVALSRRRFEQRFRQAVGRSPGDEIRRLRIERAKALLSETHMSLAEITRRCGYGHAPALAAAFRRVVGESPSEYRKHDSGR